MDFSQCRVLLVDDSASNVALLQAILSDSHIQSETALSGREALEAVKKYSFDLILLDIMMPEIDGLEVCRRLKSTPETAAIPVVLITGMSHLADASAGFALGAADYIVKPIKNAEVLARIKNHLSIGLSQKALKAELESRIRLQEELEAAQKLYRLVSDFAIDWELYWDETGALRYCNNRCESLTGYPASEFLSGTLSLPELAPPGQREMVEHALATADEHNETICEFELITRHSGGRYCLLSARPVHLENGHFSGIRANIRDITDRKLAERNLKDSEARFSKIFDSAPSIMFLVGPDTEIILMNKAGLLFVKKTLTSVYGLRIGNVFACVNSADHTQGCGYGPNCTSCVFRTCVVNTLERDTVFQRQESAMRLLGDTGQQEFNMLISTSVIKPGPEKVVLVAIDNITQVRQLEREMFSSVLQAEARERAHFAKELHDGIGPLISILYMHLHNLEKWGEEEQRAKVVANISNLLDEASRQITEISHAMSPHVLNNYGLVKAIRSFVAKINTPQSPDIEFQTDITFRLDQNTELVMYRIATELINNSLKYAKATRIHMILSRQDDKLIFEYADNGCGFDVEATLSRAKGMGLSNMKNRVSMLNGAIEFTSAPDAGFSARVVLQASLPLD